MTSISSPNITGALVDDQRKSDVGTYQAYWNLNYDTPLASDFQSQIYTSTHFSASLNGYQLWAFNDQGILNGPDDPAAGALVTRYIGAQHQRCQPNGVQWAACVAMGDFTNKRSALSGRLVTIELDMECSGVDDHPIQPGRHVINLCLFPGRTYTGMDSEVATVVNLSQSSPNIRARQWINVAGKWTDAGLRFTDGTSVNSAPAIHMGDDKAIAWSNTKWMKTFWKSTINKLVHNWNGKDIWTVDPSGNTMQTGALGVNGVNPPPGRRVITGSRTNGAALHSLLSVLSTLGFITDNTTA